MSTEQSENFPDKNFEESIEEIYQQYRHRQLASQLEDIAETMEETILQRILAQEFLQTDIEIDDDAKQAVTEARELLEEGDFETLGGRINVLRSEVEDQKRQVSNDIHKIRIGMQSRVNGMRRLNERVERVSEVRLQAVHELLSDWDWKGQVYRNDEWSFERLKQRAADYGKDMREYFEECREEIFGPYVGTPLESIVEGLLSDQQLFLGELTNKQIDLLRDSDLEDYVELSLS